VQLACAELNQVEAIVTRDRKEMISHGISRSSTALSQFQKPYLIAEIIW
jgi:hypothetical protein